MNKDNEAFTSPDLIEDARKVREFSQAITNPIVDAATKPNGKLDVALLVCGLGYFIDKSLDIICKGDGRHRRAMTDFLIESFKTGQKRFEDKQKQL